MCVASLPNETRTEESNCSDSFRSQPQQLDLSKDILLVIMSCCCNMKCVVVVPVLSLTTSCVRRFSSDRPCGEPDDQRPVQPEDDRRALQSFLARHHPDRQQEKVRVCWSTDEKKQDVQTFESAQAIFLSVSFSVSFVNGVFISLTFR